MNKGLQAGLIALTLALYATNWLHAQSTWTGASGGTWGTAGNWSPATVPNAVDAVVNINTALSVDVQNTGSGGTFPYTFGTLSIPSGAVVMGDPNNSGEQLKAQVSTGVPTFAISSGATLWFYFILNGTQGFNKTGAGELTFRYNYETQPYTGSIIISGGDICLTQDSNLGNTSNGITFSNNARLYLNPYTPTAISLASSRTLTLACSAANLDVATGNTFTIPGVIGESSAGQGLQKNGSGPLVLSGTNTYTGATKISGGTLSVGATNNLGAPAANVLFDGGTLQITGTTMTNFGHPLSFTSGKTVTLDIDNAGNTFTADQVFAQGSGGLAKVGPGTLALSQANTYTGTTTITEGTLKLVPGGSLSAGSSVNITDGTTLDVSSLGTYTLGSSASLTASTTGRAAMIKGGSSGTVNLGTRPITVNYNLLNPPLVVSSGALSLSGQTITVNTAQPLGNGTYNLIQVTSGNLVHSGTFTAAGNATNGATGRAIGFTTNAGIAYVQLTISGSTNTTAFLGGTGLRGDYFNSLGFTNLVATQADATIDFNWGSTPPVGGLGASYTVRWTGQVAPLYSETYTFQVAARSGARLWVNDKMLAARSVSLTGTDTISGTISLLAGRSYNLMVEYICNTNSSRVQLAWSSLSQPWQVVPQNRLSAVPLATSDSGTIQEEYWQGLAGTNLATLTGNVNYPNHPSGRELLLTFESLAPNWTTNLGTRVSGWLMPLTNGNYQFAVAAADTAQLWLSTDATTNNEMLIASVPSASGFRQFTTYGSQQSVSIPLVGGQKYFVELLQKAATNSSYFSVGWQPPGASGYTVIPGDFLAPNGLHSTQPTAANLFNTLATGHPRLQTSPERFAWLKQCIASNSPTLVVNAWINASNAAVADLTSALSVYDPAGMPGAGQTIQSDMMELGTAYFITGNTNFAERAWLELSNACTFANWIGANGANNGLSQGEMTFGVGLGYDWFYNYLTPARRNSLTNAMVTLGVNPSQNQYPGSWYVQSTANNWAMVFNCGASELAIALADDLPAPSQTLLNSALNSMRSSLGHFTTDNGGYHEGSQYFDYGVTHLIQLLAGVQSSLGTQFSLDDTPGLDDTALFEIYNTGPTKKAFDYSDSYPGNIAGNGLNWLSRRFNRPVAAWWKNVGAAYANLEDDLFWYDPRSPNMAQGGYVPDSYFRGPAATTTPVYSPLDMAIARTKWNDVNASFLGFKASAVLSHGHLDQGGFVFDANNYRWFVDLGIGAGYTADTNYFDAVQGWWIYSKRAEGHNTLVLNPQLNTNTDQSLTGVSTILYNSSDIDGDQSMSIADLTPSYTFSSQAPSRVWRGTKLFNNRVWLMVQDEIVSATGQNLWWFSHFSTSGTTWGVSADGSSVTLTNSGNRLWVKLLAGGANFAISNAVPLPTSPNPSQIGVADNWTGYRKLALHLTGVTNSTIAVMMVPLLPGDSAPQRFPVVVPLANWPTNDLSQLTSTPPIALAGTATVTNTSLFNFDLRSVASDAVTPSNQLFFTTSLVSTGSVALLADGHTAQFSPPASYVGAASFNYTVNNQWMDPRLLFYYDFQPGNWTNRAQPNDLSGHWHDGTFDTNGTGSYASAPIMPSALAPFLSQSARLVDSGTSGARLTRGISTAEWNLSQTSWTFSGWFRRESMTSLNYLLYVGTGNGGGGSGDELELYGDASGGLILRHWNASNAQDLNLAASGAAGAGVWNHVAVTYTTTNGTSGLVRLYANGVPVGSATSVTWSLHQEVPLRIGAHANAPNAGAGWLDGEMAEIAMFKGALSAAEIASLTNRTVAQFGGATATNSVTFNVISPPLPPAPVLSAFTNRMLIGGGNLSVASQASDFSVPPQRLLFSLPTAPAGASINATNGVIAWRPTVAQSGASNLFVVVVTQNGWLTNVSPAADAYVRDGSSYSNVNFGAATVLNVKLSGAVNAGNIRESYLRFSLPTVPGSLASVKLQLVAMSTSVPGINAVAFVTDDTWGESTLTWSNKPASGAALTTWTPAVGVPVSADVTGAAATELAGDGLLSFRVYGTTTTADGLVGYGSREGAATNTPMLVVLSTNWMSLSATQSFWVTVTAPQKPLITGPNLAAGQFNFSISGDAGPDYTIQGVTNLASPVWQTLFTTNAPLLPFQWTDTNTPQPQFFYRVLLGP